MNELKDMWNDGLVMKAIILFLVGFILLIPLIIYDAIQEQKQWEKFEVEHSCKLVETIQSTSTTSFGMLSDGKMGMITSTTPTKNAFLCDDGVKYWR